MGVLEEKKYTGFNPQVYAVMMKQVEHWAEHLGELGPDGPLEDPEGEYEAAQFRDWAVKSAASAEKHIELSSHYWAEVAQHVLPAERGKAFLRVAMDMVGEDPALSSDAQKYALGVFQGT